MSQARGHEQRLWRSSLALLLLAAACADPTSAKQQASTEEPSIPDAGSDDGDDSVDSDAGRDELADALPIDVDPKDADPTDDAPRVEGVTTGGGAASGASVTPLDPCRDALSKRNCASYGFTYTELHGYDVSVGNGQKRVQGGPSHDPDLIVHKPCLIGATIQPGKPERTRLSSARDGMSSETLANAIFVQRMSDIPEQAAVEFAQHANEDLDTLTGSVAVFSDDRSPHTSPEWSERKPASRDCGESYVWLVRKARSFGFTLALHFPSVDSKSELVATVGNNPILNALLNNDIAISEPARTALAKSGARVEIHVASTGPDHEAMRTLLSQSACSSTSFAACDQTIAALQHQHFVLSDETAEGYSQASSYFTALYVK